MHVEEKNVGSVIMAEAKFCLPFVDVCVDSEKLIFNATSLRTTKDMVSIGKILEATREKIIENHNIDYDFVNILMTK